MGYTPGNNRRHDPKNAVDSTTISRRWHGDNRRSDDYESMRTTTLIALSNRKKRDRRSTSETKDDKRTRSEIRHFHVVNFSNRRRVSNERFVSLASFFRTVTGEPSSLTSFPLTNLTSIRERGFFTWNQISRTFINSRSTNWSELKEASARTHPHRKTKNYSPLIEQFDVTCRCFHRNGHVNLNKKITFFKNYIPVVPR